MRDTFWDARREIRELRARMDQAFRLARQQQAAAAGQLAPPLDCHVGPEGFTLIFDVPGVDRASLNVKVEHGVLTVTGEKPAADDATTRVLRRERAYGTFRRTIPLPEDADPSQVTAKLQDGELRISIGRQAEAGPRRIEVVAE